jgi:hypothetical protein
MEWEAIRRGMVAGLIATIALSVVMLLQSIAGVMPDVNVIAMLGELANEIAGLPDTSVVGWFLHGIIGIVLGGGLFALAYSYFPGKSALVRGMIYAVMVWLLMMIAIMPMGDLGFFATDVNAPVPVVMLVLHLLFGAILGFSYEKLTTPEQRDSISMAPPGPG